MAILKQIACGADKRNQFSGHLHLTDKKTLFSMLWHPRANQTSSEQWDPRKNETSRFY